MLKEYFIDWLIFIDGQIAQIPLEHRLLIFIGELLAKTFTH